MESKSNFFSKSSRHVSVLETQAAAEMLEKIRHDEKIVIVAASNRVGPEHFAALNQYIKQQTGVTFSQLLRSNDPIEEEIGWQRISSLKDIKNLGHAMILAKSNPVIYDLQVSYANTQSGWIYCFPSVPVKGKAYRQFLVGLEAYVLSLCEDDTLSLMGYQEMCDS